MQAPENHVQKLLGDFWASGLDVAAVEADGAQPIAPLLSRIDSIRRDKDIPPAIAALHQVGIPVLFQFTPDVDLANLDRHIGYFTQGGLGLTDPTYYTRADPDTQALLGRYKDYVERSEEHTSELQSLMRNQYAVFCLKKKKRKKKIQTN